MKYKIIKNFKNYCKVKIFKIKKGFVNDISNIFRRMILINSKSYKIEYLLFKEIKHEYTYIDGINEDVMEIILNFRKVLIKANNFNKIYINIKKKGPGYLYAKDIELPVLFKVLNKNFKIFKINKNFKIKFLLKIKKISIKGKIKKNKSSKNKLYVNSFISPVKNIEIIKNNIDDCKNFYIKIFTNGTVDSKKIFVNSFKKIKNFFK
ncbi:hypothetical protein ACWNYQ_00795 [Candidatus Vidania fulgoroideorum]